MRLNNEFTVDAPLARTWAVLVDMQRVLACVPGARLEPAGADNLYRGDVTLDLGPATGTYRTTAQLIEVDEDGREATIGVDAREAGGAGTLGAAIRNRLEEGPDSSTRVIIETDVKATGRAGQLDQSALEALAARMLGDLAPRLADEAVNGTPSEPAQPAPAPRPEPARPAEGVRPEPPREDADDVLDLGSVLSGPLARYGVPGAAGAAALVLLASVAGRRRRFRRGIEFRYEW